RTAQVISVLEDSVQLMDMENYQTFEALKPEEEEIKNKLTPGVEVEYWSVLGKNKIIRIKS
ncbi:MAG: translation initiation factor IF-5A, partial [Candidatus Bathyarchaeia archaeon]